MLRPDRGDRVTDDGNFQGHDLDGRTCWCVPRVEQVCPACRADDVLKLACTRCGGAGSVPEFTEDPAWPAVVVHKDATRTMLN
jgi:hypothetical protein